MNQVVFIPSDSKLLEGYKMYGVNYIPYVNEKNQLVNKKVDKGGMLLTVYNEMYFIVDFYDPHKLWNYLCLDICDSVLDLDVEYKGRKINLPFIARHIDENVFKLNVQKLESLVKPLEKKFIQVPMQKIGTTKTFDDYIYYLNKMRNIYKTVNDSKQIEVYDNCNCKQGYTIVPILYNFENKKIFF